MLQDSAKVVVYEPTPNILTIRFFSHLLFTEVVWIVLHKTSLPQKQIGQTCPATIHSCIQSVVAEDEVSIKHE